jgi:hypothetical protein
MICIARIYAPALRSPPATFMRHPGSQITIVSAPLAMISLTLFCIIGSRHPGGSSGINHQSRNRSLLLSAKKTLAHSQIRVTSSFLCWIQSHAGNGRPRDSSLYKDPVLTVSELEQLYLRCSFFLLMKILSMNVHTNTSQAMPRA